ncbi:hypothetical protein LTR56_026513 [Elasticomyces elasticus]|nr:hypothetical protein LTR56_026513 [Elasticomyces elasticus]KAK3617766.1 hypothetical protein LTR22_026627 [Elasticomyces elasticus]KAK4901891.1 hypothetical protein LTR49_027188 [Elasticomyces elasticus]
MGRRSRMKQPEGPRKEHSSNELDKLTISDLLSLFPHPNAAKIPILSPLERNSSASAGIDTSGSFPQKEANVQKRQSLPTTLLERPLPSDVKESTRPMSHSQAQSSFLREDNVSPQAMHADLIGSMSDISSHNIARRATPVDYHDPYAAAIGKQKESLKLASKKSLEHAGSQPLSMPDNRDRVGRESGTEFAIKASYMMAVTYQEMALLVMMRNKRASMKGRSYAEGSDLLEKNKG